MMLWAEFIDTSAADSRGSNLSGIIKEQTGFKLTNAFLIQPLLLFLTGQDTGAIGHELAYRLDDAYHYNEKQDEVCGFYALDFSSDDFPDRMIIIQVDVKNDRGGSSLDIPTLEHSIDQVNASLSGEFPGTQIPRIPDRPSVTIIGY